LEQRRTVPEIDNKEYLVSLSLSLSPRYILWTNSTIWNESNPFIFCLGHPASKRSSQYQEEARVQENRLLGHRKEQERDRHAPDSLPQPVEIIDLVFSQFGQEYQL
jgi:hypothetical protein